MQRVPLENRAQKDKFGQGKHGFQSGNPSTGVLATIPGAAWFDCIQEEMAAIVEQAGFSLNNNDNHQVSEAIRVLIKQATPDRVNTADKLTTARNIGGVMFDGSKDIDLPGVNTIGNQDTTGSAASASKLLDERNIGGVSFNGTQDIDLPGVNKPGNQNTSGNAATASKLSIARQIGGILFDGTQNINLPGVNIAGNQDTTGNARSATKLQTSRQFILNGAVAGSCSFNGEGDAVINTTQVIGLGINQDWVDVTPWRAYGTVYVNQTQSPIYLSISFYHTNKRQAELWIDNVLIGEVTTSNEDSQRKALSGIVQPGKGYILNGNLDIRTWSELRRG